MSFFSPLIVFALNLAIAASLCLGVALLLSRRFASLPKRYGTLSAGLAGCLLAPAAVALGTWLSLGMLPSMDVVASRSPATNTLPVESTPKPNLPPVRQPMAKTEAAAYAEDRPRTASPAPVVREPARLVAASSQPKQREIPPVLSQSAPRAEPVADANAWLKWTWLTGLTLILAWLLGCAIMIARQLRNILRCRAFLSSCQPVADETVQALLAEQCQQLGIANDVRLLESNSLPAPLVVAWWRPTVVLPTDINLELSSCQFRSVLAHELAHIQRRDHWTTTAQAIAVILYWWNPLVHGTVARMNGLREMICDDIATSLNLQNENRVEPTDYAESLVKMAERAVRYQQMAGSLGISLSSYSEMERRIRRILSERTSPVELRITKRFLAGLTALSLLLVVGLAFAQVPAEKPPVSESKETAPAKAAQEEKKDETKSAKNDQKPKKTHKLEGVVLDQDGKPVAGATVHVVSAQFGHDEQLTTDKQGHYQTDAEIGLGYRRIYAMSPDGKRMGFYKPPGVVKEGDSQVAEIRLEPIKTAQVKVVDGEGAPIEAAQVALQLGHPSMAGPATTNAEGIATLTFPESEQIQSAIAWKDHAGFDYKLYSLPYQQAGDQLTKKPEFPLDGIETLELTGAKPLTVHVTDTDGKPLPKVKTHVWLLKKEQESDQLNFSYYLDCFTRNTDATGSVAFNWFPAWQKEATTVWPKIEGYVRARGMYEPVADAGTLNVKLDRLVPLRGKVTLPDGKPAADIYVSAIGDGYSFDDFRGGGKTDENGRYEIFVSPNQIYMLSIYGKEWSAPAQSGFAVLPGEEVPEHDFVLAPSTRVYGQVLNKATGKPVAGELLYLTQKGKSLNDIGKEILPNPEKSNRWVSPFHQLNRKSGDEGEFEFFVGEGEYSLFISGYDAEKFTLAGEAEKKVNLSIEVDEKVLFTGKVLDDQTGKPIAGAKIHAVSRNFNRHNDWQASTTNDGKFQVERYAEATYLYVTDGTRTLGTIAEIDANETNATFRLKKLGSATGRLMTEDGSQVAAGVKLYYGYRIQDITKVYSSNRFGALITTDEKGQFTMPALAPGWEYECALHDHPSGYVLNVAKVTVEPGQTVDLGKVNTPEAPKPYVPPTLAERTQSAFEIKGTPLERLASGKRNIKIVNQNLLIVFADPTDPRVKSLMQIRFEDEDFRAYRDDFRFMAIPTDQDRLEAAQTLAQELKLPPLSNDELLLVIVNREGELAGKITAGQICEGEAVAKTNLFSQLDHYKIKPHDARQLLDEALAKAARENKRVLVQETATWCGPCLRLSRLLLEKKQWEKDYVWVKMDHRWTGAAEIMKEMRGEASGGIPWFAILDAEGNKLATSNLPDSGNNIGFPSEATGQEHFANMLKATRQRMTDQEIADLAAAAGEK
ncbi:hypothetical protein DTL42_13665 [Bremerella cremea]|uniref:Peptidase M56 domain-containing protein n=1 Tax=Bremerella cremea TaxID=1031537 RepID=A0A368KQD5_9BACT|nr:M56 family metallopeptidase [Bremerella cremea]RCS48247.1 hypothetical protein DTL42_13665 [Bremerella cremea]